MKYIDKSLHKQRGEQIVSEFLDCFHTRTGTYPDDMYKTFCQEIDDAHGHIKFSKRLKDEVLAPEQDGRCCYCMKKLSTCLITTVEHVMPNHAKDKNELDKYRAKPTALDGLPHTADFIAMSPVVYPPHPHSIAYQNLILSCDGDLFNEKSKPVCCNLKRQHAFLPPVVLYPNITQTFRYLIDGTAEWTEDPEPPESRKNVVKVLGLNSSVLKMVRRIWFFCTDNGIDLYTTPKEIVVNTMMGYIASPSTTAREVTMLLNFKKDKYWNLLFDYDAFAAIKHS